MTVPQRPNRKHYPFATMGVNPDQPEILECESRADAKLARCAAHSHGYRMGWKFVTIIEESTLYVWRIS